MGVLADRVEKATLTTADFDGPGQAPLSYEHGEACPQCRGTTDNHEPGCPLDTEMLETDGP